MSRLPGSNRSVLERVLRAIQGNFDHMDLVIRDVMRKHNALDDNVLDLTDYVNDNIVVQGANNETRIEEVAAAAITDHDALTGVSADDHHAQGHNHTGGDSSGVLTADEHDSYSEIAEIADPSAPAANKARLYVKDNGAGKTQLAVLFPSGAVQVLITEP